MTAIYQPILIKYSIIIINKAKALHGSERF